MADQTRLQRSYGNKRGRPIIAIESSSDDSDSTLPLGDLSTKRVSTLPTASAAEGEMYFVEDASWPGPCVVVSDGSRWIRTDTSEIVRAHFDVETKSISYNGTGYVEAAATTPPQWFMDKYEYNKAWSVECVFRLSADVTAALVSFMDNSASVRGWMLERLAGGAIRLLLQNNTTGPNAIDVQTSGTPTSATSTWYKVSASYDGSESASGVTIVVDQGSAESLTTNSDTLTGTIASSSADLSLGARRPANDLKMNGYIHRVRLWSAVAMTDTQLAAAQQNDAGVPTAGVGQLDCYYRCGNGWDAHVTDPILNYAGAGRHYETGQTATTIGLHMNSVAAYSTVAPSAP